MTKGQWLECFSRHLAKLMVEEGYNQMSLSERTGINQSCISRYLNGKIFPDLPSLMAIADALHVNLDYLTYFGEPIDIDEDSYYRQMNPYFF